jgi:mannose-1-phosphate guanylyltransferase
VISDMSLVKETQIRVALELPKERMLFLLNRLHEPYYSDILSDIGASNFIEQPRNIGTAPAILYSLLKIAAADPQAIVAFFPSDHCVSDNAKFMAHIRRAFEAAGSAVSGKSRLPAWLPFCSYAAACGTLSS